MLTLDTLIHNKSRELLWQNGVDLMEWDRGADTESRGQSLAQASRSVPAGGGREGLSCSDGEGPGITYSWCSSSTSSVPDPALTTWLMWIHWMLSTAPWHWYYGRELKDTIRNRTQAIWQEPGFLTTALGCLIINPVGLSVKPVPLQCWPLESLLWQQVPGLELPEGKQRGQCRGSELCFVEL